MKTICGQCGEILNLPQDYDEDQFPCPVCGSTIHLLDVVEAQLSPDQPDPGDDDGPVQTFPQLEMASSPPGDVSSPYASPSPYVATSPSGPYVRQRARNSLDRVRPHRGGLLLFFGIMSLFFNGCTCYLMGALVWYTAADDLKAMRVGLVDASGHGLTQAAMVLAIISTVLHVLLLLLNIVASLV